MSHFDKPVERFLVRGDVVAVDLIDRLIDLIGLPTSTVSATLLKREMKRLVRPLPGFRYIKR